MEQPTDQLSENEVRERLAACKEQPEVVEEIYDFGKILLARVSDDIRHIELKAASLAAYAGAIITLLVSTSATWARVAGVTSGIIAVGAGCLAFVAACFSVSGLALRKFEWISQKEWLSEKCLGDVHELKRFRVLTMWGVISSYRRAHTEKADRLVAAQSILVLSVGLLLAALIAGLVHYGSN
jgi:hypothetical protein